VNKTEFVKLALSGKPVVLVEYRSFKEETLRYRVKAGPTAGQAVTRLILKHSVEMGETQVSVSEWLPDDAKPGVAQPPFKKSQMAVLELKGMTQEQGFYKAEGTLFPYDPTETK